MTPSEIARSLYAVDVYRSTQRTERDARAWARAYRICFWFSAIAIGAVVVRAFLFG